MWSWEEVFRQDLICPAVCVPGEGILLYPVDRLPGEASISRGAQAEFKVWQWQEAVCLLLLGVELLGECLIGCARYHSPRRIHVCSVV